MQILSFPDYWPQAESLGRALDCPVAQVAVRHFPDGESLVQLPAEVGEQVVLCRSLNEPNDKLVELMLAAATARELGAKRLVLVAPYLCYMRQDMAFLRGQAVSQRIVGRFLAGYFDTVVTVDPHLHRISDLHEAVPAHRAVSLSAAGLMGEFLAEHLHSPLVVGPDEESRQWVQAVAEPLGLEYVIGRKLRHGDREVSIELPERNYRGLEAVIVDDMASTARTLEVAALALKARGAARVHVLVTHALFVEDAIQRLKRAGVHGIWSTDSIAHPSNCIPLAGLLAGTLHPRDSAAL